MTNPNAQADARQSMIKFSGVENEDGDSERETNFVRQKTPHPRELKAKAHKLFGSSPLRPGGPDAPESHQVCT